MAASCPCDSNRPYLACCGPYHRGEREAPDAVALMRSRYSAYAKREHGYLHRTLHPDHDDRALPRERYVAALAKGTRHHRYLGLRILDATPPDAEGVAEVLFFASVRVKGRDRSFVEHSRFAHADGGWRYLFGAIIPEDRVPAELESLTLAETRDLR